MSTKTETQRVKLTDSLAEKADAPESGRAVIWDTACPNFGLRITGKKKAWIVRVKVRGVSKERTIDTYPGALSATAARDEAFNRIAEFKAGIDREADLKKREEEERARAASELTIAQAMKRYLSDNTELSERTRSDYEGLIDNELASYKETKLQDVTREAAEQMMRDIVADLKKGKGKSGSRANQALRAVRMLCLANEQGLQNWGKRRGKSFPWVKTKAVRTGLDPDAGHGKAIWDALGSRRCDTSADYVKALLLTGARRGEMAAVKISDISLRNRTMTLLDTKNGEDHVIQMSDQLIEIVERHMIDRETGSKRGADESLFTRCSEPKKLLASVSAEIGVKFTCHSLRKFFAITCLSLGIPGPVIKACLNHSSESSQDVTDKHYAHATPSQMRQAWQQVADMHAPRVGVISLNALRDAAA